PRPPPHPTLSLHDALPIYENLLLRLIGKWKVHVPPFPCAANRITQLLRDQFAIPRTALRRMRIVITVLLGDGVHHGGHGEGLVRSEEHTSELQSRENLVCR